MSRWLCAIPASIYALLAMLYAGGIFILSSLPGDRFPSGGIWTRFASNLFHAPLFGGLSLLVTLALVDRRDGRLVFGWNRFWLVVTIGLAYAGFDEWHQSFTRGRSPDWLDIITDGAGISVAALLVRSELSRRPLGGVIVGFVVVAIIAAWCASA